MVAPLARQRGKSGTVTDYLSILRETDEAERRERERITAAKQARESAQDELNDAWNDVYKALREGDNSPDTVPDLSPLLALGKFFKVNGGFSIRTRLGRTPMSRRL